MKIKCTTFIHVFISLQVDYDAVIAHILHLLEHQVKIITSDFETAVWQSIRGLLPNVRLVGCLFHYTQALLRFIQGMGLQQAYQTDIGTKSLGRMYMALPVLPHEHIEPVFEILSASAPPMFAPFIQYIRNQWILGAVFTIRDLSIFQMTVRTKNDVEGYHYRINAKAHKCKYPFINNSNI